MRKFGKLMTMEKERKEVNNGDNQFCVRFGQVGQVVSHLKHFLSKKTNN